MDRSPPGSSAHGISQARILEWAAVQKPPGAAPWTEPQEGTSVEGLLGGGALRAQVFCYVFRIPGVFPLQQPH